MLVSFQYELKIWKKQQHSILLLDKEWRLAAFLLKAGKTQQSEKPNEDIVCWKAKSKTIEVGWKCYTYVSMWIVIKKKLALSLSPFGFFLLKTYFVLINK